LHVITAGDQQHMPHLGAFELIHHRGEVGEGVGGAVIQLHATGIKTLVVKQPVGVFRITATAHQHRQSIPLGKLRRHALPFHIAAQHQDQLGRRQRRLPEPP